MGSHGIKDRVAIVGMGCTRFAEHWDKGLDDLLARRHRRGLHRRPASTKDDVDAYWLGTAQGGMSGMLLAKPLQLEGKPVTRVENMCATGSEALRQAAYAVASRRLRPGHGGRRREGEGLRLPGPQRLPRARTTARSARSPRRPCSRWSRPPTPSATACRWTSSRRCSPASRRRTTTTAPATRARSSAGRCRWSRSSPCPTSPAASRCSTAPAWPTGRRPPSSCRAEDAHRYTDSPLYVKALSFVAGNGSGLTDPGVRLHDLPRDRAPAPRTPTRRPASPTRAPSWPWPRCTTASRPPSSCSWRTSASASAARRGRRSRPAPSTSTGDLPVNPDGGLKSLRPPGRRVRACA